MSRMNTLSMGAACWSSLYEESQDSRGRLIEEILVAEMLTRVTVGLLMAQGRLHGSAMICRTAMTVFNDHQEARRSALLQMVEMADAKNPGVRKLDRIRRTAERWSDLLLGPMLCRWNVRDLAFDQSRSKDYGQSLLPHLLSPVASGLFAAGIRVAFSNTIIGVPSHAGFHRSFAGAVLRCLPEDLFERDGGMLPLRTVRALRFQPAPETSPPKFRKSAVSPKLPQTSTTPPPKLSFSKLRRQRQNP